jgi:hypothetical protein
MREIIFLTASRQGIGRMTKNLPALKRGEIPVKLVIEVDEAAFREPVIERHVHIADWRDGIDIADVELCEAIITEAEAEQIRAQRLAAMRKILQDHGYEVTPAASPEGGSDG